MITHDRIKDILLSSKSAGTIKVGFLMVLFSMIAFSAAIEPLRVANRMSGDTLFEWVISSPTDEPIRASYGVRIDVDSTLADLADCRLVFVCGGLDVQSHTDQNTLNVTRRLDRQGAIVGAICTGTYVLAAAGLLNESRCTIHWKILMGLPKNSRI